MESDVARAMRESRPLGLELAALLLLLALGCRPAAAPPPAFRPIADTKLLMQAVLEPEANRIANALGQTNCDGSERPPTHEEWVALRDAAVALAESGNLLLMPPRVREGAEWIAGSQALIEVGVAAMKAAESENAQQLSEISEKIYTVCSDCHQKYPPATASVR
jgi:hypothetical protein